MKKLISIVISAYNEERGLNELVARLKSLMNQIKKYDFEVIIVDNGSADRTFDILSGANKRDRRFRVVQLSRNFEPHGGQTAGLNYAKGDAVVIMDADLQDPPEVIPKFISKWEQGYEIVYGIIKKRKGVSLARKIASPFFYWVLNVLTSGKLPKNATDFRLIDKKVYTQINKMPEHGKYIRGLIVWTGFRQIGVPFVRAARAARGGAGGAVDFSVFGFISLTYRFITNAIFSFSTFPLKIITWIGVLTSLSSFIAAIYFFAYHMIHGVTRPGYVTGYTSTMLIMLFLFGILFMFLGVIGEYIARIYDEVKQRPNFIVRQTIGFGKKGG